MGLYAYRLSVIKQLTRMENELRQLVEYVDQVTGSQGPHWTLEKEPNAANSATIILEKEIIWL